MNPDPTLYTDSGAAAAAAVTGGISGLIGLAFAVLAIVGMWKIFTKAGEPGWYSIIPIWNTIVMIKIVGRPMWWFLLLFVPIVNIVILVILMLDLSKVFGKGMGFTIGLILLPYIFMIILGFDSSRYLGTGGVAAAAAPAAPAYQPPPPPPTA